MFQSVLERQVAAAEEAVRAAVAAVDPDDIPASEAVRLFERLDRIVRSATAGRTLLARRVEDSQVWQRKGHRSAAEHVAAVTGTSDDPRHPAHGPPGGARAGPAPPDPPTSGPRPPNTGGQGSPTDQPDLFSDPAA
jgi:hypothetical protein